MEEIQFAVFKGTTTPASAAPARSGRSSSLSARWRLSPPCFSFFGLIALVLPFGAWLQRAEATSLWPRYLICGNEIVHYGNVDKLMLDSGSGQLRAVHGRQPQLQ